jgi:hypothetical protein
MRALFINEQNFEKGINPKDAMGIGRVKNLMKHFSEAKYPDEGPIEILSTYAIDFLIDDITMCKTYYWVKNNGKEVLKGEDPDGDEIIIYSTELGPVIHIEGDGKDEYYSTNRDWRTLQRAIEDYPISSGTLAYYHGLDEDEIEDYDEEDLKRLSDYEG